jgi:hypothetical protein
MKKHPLAALCVLLCATPCWASFTFSTGDPDGLIGTLSRPPSAGLSETESADDFILPSQTSLTSATVHGLLINGATVSGIPRVTVDIYRVFPNDSDASRTITVPTRANSPGDIELVGRDTDANDMTFSAKVLNSNFSVAHSIINGIHPSPNQTTGGEGPQTGTEVEIDITFTTPIDLPADHYFFRPEVGTTTGEFLFLSAAKPTTPPFAPDLQSWTRNETIFPDWLRIGTDVVGPPAEGGAAPAFNASFSLKGETGAQAIPLPPAAWSGLATIAMFAVAQRKALLRSRRG